MTDKNFTVRLRAYIEKQMQAAGLLDRIMNGSENYDDYEESLNKFFSSIDGADLANASLWTDENGNPTQRVTFELSPIELPNDKPSVATGAASSTKLTP